MRLAALLVTVVLGAVLLAIDERLWDEGGPGVVGFELAGFDGDSERILAEWGRDGRSAARISLLVDFPFLVAYSAFWALAVPRLRALAVAAGAFDALENVCLLIVLGGSTSTFPLLAATFATVKFACLAVVIGYAAIQLARRFPRAALALAGVAVVALALNTWLVERATAPADPDVGRILELPGGDVQVREDGPRGGPPVVLVHGFGGSLHWWDGVTPALARELRVVRLDLLGHGGSEKPGAGYSMEDQADLVAGVIRRLGLRRPAVVGHSMGGLVGTALVERHRSLVARLMLVASPPDDRDQEVQLTARLPFLPVTGHVIDTLIDDRLVRRELERGFAPEFDPPARLVDDIFDRTTHTSLRESLEAIQEFWDERPVHERLRAAGVPVTVLLGEGERHTRRSTRLYNSAGARTVVMEALDHTPQVESPARTAPLIAAFAAGR